MWITIECTADQGDEGRERDGDADDLSVLPVERLVSDFVEAVSRKGGAMIITVSNMLVCGLVVAHGPKRSPASAGRPRCRDNVCLEEDSQEGHSSTMSCSGSSSGPQPREGAEHIIIDEHALNAPHSLARLGEPIGDRNDARHNGLAGVANAASSVVNPRKDIT